MSFSAQLPTGLDWPADPDVVESLNRISSRAGIVLPFQGWPISTSQVRAFISQASAVDAVSSADSMYLSEIIDSSKELKRWVRRDTNFFLAIEPQVLGEIRQDSSLRRTLGSLGGRLYGSLNGEIRYFSRALISTELANQEIYYDRYQDPDGEPSGVSLDPTDSNNLFEKRTFARYICWVQWQKNWLNIKFGRDALQHGPGEWTGLSTSRFAAPNTFLDFRADLFQWLTIQSTTIKLLPSDIQGGSRLPTWFEGDSRKWMHIHRYEIRPATWMSLAFQDQVVYPDSAGISPEYFLPLAPIFFTQDLEGNGPNAAMQFDWRFGLVPNFSLWGVLYIDDLDGPESVFGDDHWLNRWAALLGFEIVSPFKKIDADVTAEVSIVRPWTFTEARSNGCTFASYGRPIGSEGGADSRSIHFRLAYRPTRYIAISPEYENQESGLGRGGKLGLRHDDAIDGSYTGVLERSWHRQSFSITGDLFFEQNKKITTRIGYSSSDSSKYSGVQWGIGSSISW